jgi:hypothetical protein
MQCAPSKPCPKCPNLQVQIHCQGLVRAWVTQAKQHPAGSLARNQILTRLIRHIEPRLWRTNTPYYADALQQTWLYFVKNVCTIYDPDRKCIVGWLDTHLWHRHHDLIIQAAIISSHEIPIDATITNDDFIPGILKDVPAREMGSLDLLTQIKDWIVTDSDGGLQRLHVRDRPDITCQQLLLLRLPPETPWKDAAVQFKSTVSTLSNFYQKKCLPKLRDYGHREGLL